MIISRIVLKNWRNFQDVDVPLGDRVFLVGPNACGKSNFLDAFRFLRDLVKPGGGLQKALSDRGGIPKIRCLHARRYPEVALKISLTESTESSEEEPDWQYELGIKLQRGGHNLPQVSHEKVWKAGKLIIDRPNQEDKEDDLRLTQTYLEQINANSSFREISKFLDSTLYLHLVPQLIRYADAFSGSSITDDPFGRDFLERITTTPEKTRNSRLGKIESALQIAVPQLKHLTYTKDDMGIPHLEAIYEHWRPDAGKQRETQFSDGTLRLIGILWSLLEGNSLLLLEEPELSLNSGIISKLPGIMYRIQKSKKQKQQIILSTHSADLLSDQGIGGEEVLVMTPTDKGTKVELASDIEDIKLLLENGLSIADVALPLTIPDKIDKLNLFK